MDRYSRQFILPAIGEGGQRKISAAKVAIVGMGALGTVLAQLAARAGIGYLRLVDRDVVESSNLQRQVLFSEMDAQEGYAKASAAKKHLTQINSEIQIESVVDDLRADNIADILQGIDIILDGTDNFETRYLLNDYAVQNKRAFIYGGAIGTKGMVYAVLPDKRPCLRCLFPDSPTWPSGETCDRVGILASASHLTASLQFTQLIKLITQGVTALPNDMIHFDVWEGNFKSIRSDTLVGKRCEGCEHGSFPALLATSGIQTLKLCGRNAVQIQNPKDFQLSWNKLAERWKDANGVRIGADFARVKVPDFELTLFKSGRVIVKGTEDPAIAKSIYSRWIGN